MAREMVSESVWLRLGQGISGCVGHVAQALRDGSAAGVGVREARPGVPELFTVAGDDVVQTCVYSALALARARG